MHRFRPALAATAALTLSVAAAAPAMAASTATPAHGTAGSALRLLNLNLAGHSLSAGSVVAQASNAASPHVAQIVVTPAELDGTTYGQQTVTPSQSPLTVPSSPQTANVAGLASLTGPTFALTAKDGTTVLTSAVLKALGSLSIASLPVSLDASAASLTDTAEVTATQTTAEKSVLLGNLSLPSVADLLDALGIDLSALTAVLDQANLNKLAEVVGSAFSTLSANVTSAAATVDGLTTNPVPANLTDAIAAATQAASDATAADGAATAADSAFSTAYAGISVLPVGAPATPTPSEFLALASSAPTVYSALLALVPNLDTLATTAVTDEGLAAAADALSTALAALQAALQALVNAVTGAVNAATDPLASLGSISIVTKAVASANSPAPVATAKVGTLSILGALTPPADLTSALNGVLGQLSGVLNSVTGVSFTPPAVAVGVGHTARSVSGTTHNATASITAVTITLPTLTLPASLSVLDAAQSLTGGTLQIGTMSENAAYTPAVAAHTPTSSNSGGPSLAGTGSSYALPVVAGLLVMTGLFVARRRRVAEVS